MNRVALITGASRGIGRGIALELARAGYDLMVNYARQAEAAEETAAACLSQAEAAGHHVRVTTCPADIADRTHRQRLLAETRKHFGRLDLLVNNAGVAPEVRADILDADEASFDRLIATNLKGPYFLTQQAARWMMEQVNLETSSSPTLALEHPCRPKIVFITSISAYTASVQRGDYCVSKAALSMATKLFATRLARHGIAVYEIRPGIIETDMTSAVREKYDALIANDLTPIPRWGTPADVGKAVAAIAQDLLPFSTGQVLDVDGGFHLRRL